MVDGDPGLMLLTRIWLLSELISIPHLVALLSNLSVSCFNSSLLAFGRFDVCMVEAVSFKSAAAWRRTLRHCVILANSRSDLGHDDSTIKY